MPILDNPKQEAFCQARAAGKTLDEAYASAGYKPSMQHASRLARNGKIADRIAELRAKVAQTYECTLEDMVRQFDEDRDFARELDNPGAAHAASASKAKLLGFMTERSQVSVSHSYSLMSEEEIRFELASIAAEARAIKAGQQH